MAMRSTALLLPLLGAASPFEPPLPRPSPAPASITISTWTGETSPETAALIARRIRQVGLQRVLYGSDLTPPGGSIQSGWEIFRDRVPLTAEEMRTIAGNLTRFAR